jgi:hypothetical protein
MSAEDDVRVHVGGRRAGIDDLRPETRIMIRLDPAGGVIQDIRALEPAGKATVLKSARELARLGGPSEAEVLRALPRVPHEVPAVLQVFRDDIQVVTERLGREVDAPRLFPLVGVAELHHCHWTCTVYYRETVESSYPFPLRCQRPRAEVVYIDKNYLVPSK